MRLKVQVEVGGRMEVRLMHMGNAHIIRCREPALGAHMLLGGVYTLATTHSMLSMHSRWHCARHSTKNPWNISPHKRPHDMLGFNMLPMYKLSMCCGGHKLESRRKGPLGSTEEQ